MRVIIQEEALRRSEGHHYRHFIQELPTIDAEPVRYGRWIPVEMERSFGTLKGVKCSLCGEEKVGKIGSYCPNCGAKMEVVR